MLILPERNLPRGRLLLPQRPQEWRQPSQRTSLYAIENKSRFWLTARADDGYIVWRGWFDDREDADAFLFSLISGSLIYERPLWRLPTPWWPGLDPHLVYDFTTTRTLTTTSGSNQTDAVPADWNNGVNTIEVIAAGGSGGAGADSSAAASGGGAGAYSKGINTTLTPGGTATFRLTAGGVAVVDNSGVPINGNAGGDAWYNGTSLAGSSVGAKGGGAGLVSPSTSGGAGGSSGSGIGNSTKTSGGSGGGLGISVRSATGAGGAGGNSGNGNNGVAATLNQQGTNGGSADAGAGGAAGTGGTEANGTNGGSGLEFGASGSGGGGGGSEDSVGVSRVGGSGGNYGGGGGGAVALAGRDATSGAGSQAVIFITYTPFVPVIAGDTQIPHRFLKKIKMVGY